MFEERDPIQNPQAGDILKRSDDVYVLVDYVDELNTGFMCSNKVTGRYYLEGWTEWMKGATVVERGGSWAWQNPDYPTREESTEYLRQRIVDTNVRSET